MFFPLIVAILVQRVIDVIERKGSVQDGRDLGGVKLPFGRVGGRTSTRGEEGGYIIIVRVGRRGRLPLPVMTYGRAVVPGLVLVVVVRVEYGGRQAATGGQRKAARGAERIRS